MALFDLFDIFLFWFFDVIVQCEYKNAAHCVLLTI